MRLVSPRNRRSKMRGSSSAGMPGPVSRTRRTARVASRADLDVHAAAGRRVLHGVVDQVRRHLFEPGAIGGDHDVGRRARRQRHAFRVRDVAVEIHGARHDLRQRAPARGAAASSPLSASEMSISVLSITSTRSDSSTQSASPRGSGRTAARQSPGGGEASAISAVPRSRVSGVRRSCETLSSAPRIAVTSPSILSSIVLNSDVSSSIASPVPVERDARVGSAGADDPLDGERQPANRKERRLRRQPAAGQRDDDDEQRDDAERGAEARQQVVARLGALADLHERAVGERRRHQLELRRIPALVVAQDHRFDAAIDDAHEQPLGRDLLLGADGGREHAARRRAGTRRRSRRACR